jgi:uncharacterized membrane protein
MAKDLGEVIGTVVGRVGREAAQNLVSKARKSKNGPVSGLKGVAVGAGLAAAAPLAVKGASKLAKGGLSDGANPLQKPVQKVGEKVKGAASDVVDDKVKDVGGPAGIAKEAGKRLIPGVGDGGGDDKDGGGKNDADGVGKGRRMPVQQAVDVPVPVSVAYNEFTQFEEWPSFMHRVTSVSQEDETNVSFKSKIWGVSREFQAEIDEQRPDERIKWHVTQGLSHQGVATFHELAPRLTRIEVNVDVEPGSLIEKFARGARHVKRAIRADLHRFKAYVMMNEEESGAWRGTIEDAEVTSSEGDEKKDSQSGEESGSRGRSRAQAARSSGGSRRSSGSSSGGRSRSSGSSSGGRSRSSGSSSSGRSRSQSKSSGSSSSGKRTTNRSRSSKSSNGGDSSPTSSRRRKSGSRS